MALDHYVPQVHLKRFYSPALGERFYAIRKKNMARFTPNSKGVCAVNHGNTNYYLQDERIIEEFLSQIETNYNNSVDKITSDKIDNECVTTIAGIFSSIMVCSPTGMRIQSNPLRAIVQSTAEISERGGYVPPPPPELFDGKSIGDLLRDKTIQISIDPKYPQAIGIAAILEFTKTFGNAHWEVIHNRFSDCPFFTSDFPLPIEQSNDPRVLNRVFPLTPFIAVRICPNIKLVRSTLDFGFRHFTYKNVHPSRTEIIEINRRIVQCAEELVFFRDDAPWIEAFVDKHRGYWLEAYTQTLSVPRGQAVVASQRIARRPREEREPAFAGG